MPSTSLNLCPEIHIIRFTPNFGKINEVSFKVSLGVNDLFVTLELAFPNFFRLSLGLLCSPL